MNVRGKIALLIGASWLALGAEASAQLFGARSVGTPISRQASPTTASDSGLQGARFLRQNRPAQDFVGADLQGNTQHFVGAARAGQGTVAPSAVSDLRTLAATAAANRQLQAAAATPTSRLTMNPPLLQVDFAYSAPAAKLPAVLLGRLAVCPEIHATAPIEVSVAGHTAIVRGTVAGERDRFLAQQLLLFEPGILNVQNELTIQPAASHRSPPATTSPAAKTPGP